MREDNKNSKFDLLGVGIIEAGWLTAAIIAPVFFNLYTSRIFEPDKIALLRSVAMLMTGIWLICLIERWGTVRQHITGKLRNPVVLAAIAFVAVYLIATLTSVAPSFSFFGSYRRMQGTYTTLCYVIFFSMIILEMHTSQQVHRLFMTIILGSLPLAIYGIMQQLDMDPLTWSMDPFTRSFFDANRAPSTMGNPIFTGAYLCIASLLTLGRIISDILEMRKSQISLPDIMKVVSYGLIALLQVLALSSAGSRGPWVGWLVGVFFFVLLLVVLSRRRYLIVSMITAGVLGITILLALNLPISPLAKFRGVPYLSSLSHLLEGESGTGKTRTLIWEGNLRLVLPHESIQYPDGAKDRMNALRPFIGYGPEAMALVYSQFYPSELGHYEHRTLLIDRSHNEIWDTLISTGLLGLIGYQSLLICIFLFGLQRIGLISTGRERSAFLGLWIGFGIAGGFSTIALHQPKYFAVGLALGTVTGMILYILMTVILPPSPERTGRLEKGSRILLAAILAAILGNYIEVQFGISVAGTQTLFWMAAGLLVTIGSGKLCAEDHCSSVDHPALLQASVPQAKTPAKAKRKGSVNFLHPSGVVRSRTPFLHQIIGVGLSYALINALILSVLFYEFINNHERLHDPLAILWRSLTYVIHHHQSSYAVLGLIIMVWTLCSIIAACELYRRRLLKSALDWIFAWALLASSSMGMAFIFTLSLANRLKNLVSSPMIESLLVSEQIIGIHNFFCFALFLTILLTGLTRMYAQKTLLRSFRHPWALILLLPPILYGGYLWIGYSNLNPIRADTMIREGDIHQLHNRPDDAIAHFQRAVELWPGDISYSKLGGGLVAQANSAAPIPGGRLGESTSLREVMLLDAGKMRDFTRSDFFHAARTVLTHALELNPLYADHITNLANVYRRWTSLTTDSQARARLADQTIVFYKQATTISPQNIVLWNELASFYLDQKSDVDSALETIEKSFALDSKFSQTYLVAGNIYLKRQNWSTASESFSKALSVTPNLAEAYDKLAYIFYRQGKYQEAISANNSLLRVMPDDPAVWKTHENLAILYARIGDPGSALSHIEQALSRAPAANRQEMTAFRAKMIAQINAVAKSASGLR
jgi:tetratricopeptide (TPR) repeat protein